MDINPVLPLPSGRRSAPPSKAHPQPSGNSEPPARKEYFTDIDGNQVTTYEVTPDGQVREEAGLPGSPPRSGGSGGVMDGLGSVGDLVMNNPVARKVRQFFVPDNMPDSVSADYGKVRSWTFLQSVGWNAANYASGAAMAIALGLNPIWGGAAMATYNLIKDKLGLFIGFASTAAVPAIDRNPRPWIVAGEVIDHAGIMVEAATALTAGIPGALLPIGLAGCLLRTISGNVKGPSMANIEPRQARAGNLTDVSKKNGNQNVLSNLIGSAAGLYAIRALGSMGFGPLAPALVAAAGGALAIASVVGMVKSLDFHPVNEKALRRIIDGLEKEKKIVGPDRSLWGTVRSLGQRDTIVMGDRKLKPTPETIAHLKDLRETYEGRNYLLDVQDGKPIIYLGKDCTSEDRLVATMQGIYVERLREDDRYEKVQGEKGAPAADRWLVTESLKNVPADPKPLLALLEKAGWSVDVLKANDRGRRATWNDSDAAAYQYELDLPAPPPGPAAPPQESPGE